MDDNIVGATLPAEQSTEKSMLDGIGEDRVVAVYNPLPQDFRVQYARTLASPVQMTEAQRQIETKLGTPIGRDNLSPTQGHSIQYHILKAGQTENLPGDIAQIAVRQLRNYMIQTRNKGKSSNFLADPNTQREVEKEIVVRVVDNVSFINQLPVEEYTKKQLDELNPPVKTKEVNPAPGQGSNYEPAENK